jgi:DNA-binding SARP family transcriptional activator/tetratricopeptide (TPR) repeat protein
MAAQFDLHILGLPKLWDRRGALVRFRTRKQLALLTYLHFEGRERPLSRDRLAGLLWPGTSPEKSRHSLSQALLAIRARLGTNALTQRERDVQLLAELASDLDALQDGDVSLASVLEPLLGIEDCAGAEFAHWVDAARARIRGRARDSLRAALKKARSSGDLTAVHRVAMLLYGIDPLCADAIYALAERALLDGDVVMAVRLLKEQRHRAQAELGANPNPEIAQLLRRLERGERPAFLAQASALPAAFTRREVFVGREAELSQLEAVWERTRSGGYQTCLITGVPGIGKSSLLRRFATSLGARAWPAFVVSCQEIGEGIPYAAVSELIAALGRDPAAGGTDPHWLAEAARVSPGLRGTYPGIPEPPNAPTDSVRLRVAEAVLRMMDVVSDSGPMLVAFDDVHHMDPASREVLFLVTRRLDRVPVLILATSRPDTEAAAAESGRGGLAWAGGIALQPLDRAQATRLLDDLLEDGKNVDPRIQETIIRLAQGNPYFVEMLLSDWKQHEAHSLVATETDGDRTVASWSPPETLRSAFERHYRELSVEAKHLLQLLAVAERALATPEIATLLALEVGAGERLVLEMLDQGIGRVEAGRVAFKNELQRAYVYYAMGEERRSYFHTRVATWLAEGADGDDFQRKLEASHHYISARMPVEASRAALLGAELAVRRGAPGEAERALGTLLRSCPQGPESRVHLVLANALVTLEKFREALDALARWVPSAPAPSDNALAAQLEAEALHRGRLADDQAILSAAALAVSAAEVAKADLILIRALQVRAEVGAEAGHLDDTEAAGAQAERVAEKSVSPESKALAALTRGYCLLVNARLEAAVEAFEGAVPALRGLDLLVELWRALNGLGMANTSLGRLREAVYSFAQALSIARKLGDKVGICNVWNNAGVVYHNAGCFDSASRCYDLATELLSSLGTTRTVRLPVHLHANRTRLAMETGDYIESERWAAYSIAAARESQSWVLVVAGLLDRADLHLARAEHEWAWPLVKEAADLTGDRWPALVNAGQFLRLRKHMVWQTVPQAGQQRAPTIEGPLRTILDLSEQLELRAFEEWMHRERKTAQVQETAAAELVARGLFGVLARLLAIGVQFQGIPEPESGEASAQLVARVFQPQEKWRLPQVDELLQSDAALQRSASMRQRHAGQTVSPSSCRVLR